MRSKAESRAALIVAAGGEGAKDDMWCVYILLCSDSSFYIGITRDLTKRLERHNSGKGSKYTRSHRPVELVYTERFEVKEQALKREAEIKKFSSENKKKLIRFGQGFRFPSALKI